MQTPISLAIERKGLTHEQVAQALGVSRQAVTRWASGAAPTLSNLRRLAELLGVSVSSSREKTSLSSTKKVSLPLASKQPPISS